MENKEWLESLKPGDHVALNGSCNSYLIRVVSRLTKTLIVLDNGYRIRRNSGRIAGSSIRNKSSITPVTDEIRSKIRAGNLKYKISMIDFKSLSNEKLERILAIVSGVENED